MKRAVQINLIDWYIQFELIQLDVNPNMSTSTDCYWTINHFCCISRPDPLIVHQMLMAFLPLALMLRRSVIFIRVLGNMCGLLGRRFLT